MAAAGVSGRDVGQDEALRLRQQGRIQSLQALLDDVVAQRYPAARLLEAELEHDDDDRFVYEIELITADGVARELEIDARDGRVLSDKED